MRSKLKSTVCLGIVCVVAFWLAPAFGQENPVGAKVTSDEVRSWFIGIAKDAPGNLKSLTFSQREFLYDSAANHKVARLDNLGKYDPQGIIGFCFGRAMTVHLIALRMGLKPESIRKLFIVGPMMEGGQIVWRFHVTTLVLGDDATWYSIDPIVGNPLAIQHWMKRMRSIYDRAGKTKFYVTPPSVVLPDLKCVPEIPKETGQNLIEVSFEPQGKPGFTIKSGLEKGSYDVDSAAAESFFADALEKGPDKFDFLSITINGGEIPFNGYFVDLLAAIQTAPDKDFQTPSVSILASVSSDKKPGSHFSARSVKARKLPANVLSFRFNLLPKPEDSHGTP